MRKLRLKLSAKSIATVNPIMSGDRESVLKNLLRKRMKRDERASAVIPMLAR